MHNYQAIHHSRLENDTVHTAPVNSTVPEMAVALSQLVQQLDILTQTMSIIEDRLCNVEDRLAQQSLPK